MVRDDDSDRKKVVDLRHAADSETDEDKAIDGAITPDKVAIAGPAGVAVLIEVIKVEGEEVGPRKQVDKPTRGILVKGAHETPQFIPEDKIQKNAKGDPKWRNYTRGTLVRGPHGESIFYADGQVQPDDKGNPKNMDVKGVDKTLQHKIGDAVCPPCEVEVNDKGMPECRPITAADNVPKDKNATVGVIVKNRDGVCVLAQTGGQAVGAADNADCIPTTPNDKVAPGGVIGKIVEDKAGRQEVVLASKQPTAEQVVVATVVQGNYCEPVVLKTEKVSVVNTAPNLQYIAKAEKIDKAHQPQLERATDLCQAQIQGKSTAQIQKEKAELKAAAPLAQGEVYSTSFCATRENESHFFKPGIEAPAGKPVASQYHGKTGVSVFVNVNGGGGGGGAAGGTTSKTVPPVPQPPKSAPHVAPPPPPPAPAPPKLVQPLPPAVMKDQYSVYLCHK